VNHGQNWLIINISDTCKNQPKRLVKIDYDNYENTIKVSRLMVNLVLHSHREDSPLTGELPKESDQFLFLRVGCVDHEGHKGRNRSWESTSTPL
jgi:hypothetical protein